MKITTPNGTLEGDNIEAILKEHGFDCLHGANLIWGRVFKSVHLILDGVSNVFGLVQTAVKLKNKLFIRHQCRVCDSVSGKIIGNMVTDQCNKCQRKQGCNQKGNQEFCLK